MRRTYVAVVAAFLMGALLFPTAAGAKNNKVDVCHSQGNGSYHLINISEKAVGKHIANHGDGLPGDPVPGMENLNFSAACVPVDITKPVVSVPDDLTVEATSPAGAEVDFTATADDAVDGPLDPTCDPASGSTFPVGDTTVTCSATDAAGNTGSATFNVTVERSFLVRATSTDSSGNVRVIAELLDTNVDGFPSIGDTAKFYEYPKDFTGTDYGSFDTAECVLSSWVYYNLDNPNDLDTVYGFESGGCDAQWLQQGQYTTTWEYVDYFTMNIPGEFTSIPVEHFWAFERLNLGNNDKDHLRAINSVDAFAVDNFTSPTDDAFLDIEFNFAP